MSTADAESSTGRSDTVPASGVRTFVFLWCSQWLVVFAAALTVLVFRLDIFAEFDSLAALTFAFLILFAPFVLLSPFAGALVDRWGHLRVLLASNVVIGATGYPAPGSPASARACSPSTCPTARSSTGSWPRWRS